MPENKNDDIKPYFIESILILVFCRTPMGIVSLIYGVQVQAALAEEKIEDARKASEKARVWVKWGFILGIIAQVLSLILLIWIIAAGPASLKLENSSLEKPEVGIHA